MTIYVDEVFALNFLIDWLLLKTSVTLTGQRCAGWRLAIAALVGAVYAVLVLAPGLRLLARLPFRLAVFALMACVAFGFGRQALRPGLWYFGVCCGFFGLAYAVSALTGSGVLLLGGAAWYAVSFRFLALLTGLSYAAVRLLLPRLSQHRGAQTVGLTLYLGERSTAITALRDTGNTLRDPVSGERVLVADRQVLRRLLPSLPLTDRQLSSPAELLQTMAALCPQLRTRLIPYRAVGTASALLLAIRCSYTSDRQRSKTPILVALSPTPISDGGLYQALTGGSL